MIEVKATTEHEMVLAFVKAEIDSARFGSKYNQILQNSGISRITLIDQADLANDQHNNLRIQLLGAVRGYRKNQYLFQGFPADVPWRLVMLEPDELGEVLYAKFPTWITLSGGSHKTWNKIS